MTKQRGYNLIETKIGYLQRNKGQGIFRNIRNTGCPENNRERTSKL